MKINNFLTVFSAFILLISAGCQEQKKEEWIDLFNGKDLTGWKSNESEESFKVEDGVLVASGPRSHLFYIGEGEDTASFKNFELSADIMTTYTANSGIYFHTAWQDSGWPSVGLEAQINNSHKGGGDYKEVKKGGSLYSLRNVYKALNPDSVWYNLNIKVEGKRVRISVNDQLIVDYTEPVNPVRFREGRQDRLSRGTFALQCHDPDSKVYFKNMRLKVLDDNIETPNVPETDTNSEVLRLQSHHYAVTDMNIPVGDGFSIDSALSFFRQTGINLGLVTSEVDKLQAFYDQYIGYPVFVGVKLNDLVKDPAVDSTVREKFDYVIGEYKVESNVSIPDPGAYMERYVNNLTQALDAGKIDILSKATQLPESISDQYDQLWTQERMSRVVEALKANQVAVEINPQTQTPGIAFVQMAKEKGCLFTLGNATVDGEVAIEHYVRAIDEAGLDYKDIYIPDKLL